MENPDRSKVENRSAQQLASARYRYGGERYGFRGTNRFGPDDWIPQVSGLYAFPLGDTQNPEPPPPPTSTT